MPRAKADAGGSEGEKVDFELSMHRLEEIVSELEAGQLSLEDSIARYEEGMKLQRQLIEVLNQAEKRIERLVEKEGATPTTEDMGRGGESAEDELPF
jgi:exodeoxyribonuclease VII small subunit